MRTCSHRLTARQPRTSHPYRCQTRVLLALGRCSCPLPFPDEFGVGLPFPGGAEGKRGRGWALREGDREPEPAAGGDARRCRILGLVTGIVCTMLVRLGLIASRLLLARTRIRLIYEYNGMLRLRAYPIPSKLEARGRPTLQIRAIVDQSPLEDDAYHPGPGRRA